jgi:hypothetical protein
MSLFQGREKMWEINMIGFIRFHLITNEVKLERELNILIFESKEERRSRPDDLLVKKSTGQEELKKDPR